VQVLLPYVFVGVYVFRRCHRSYNWLSIRWKYQPGSNLNLNTITVVIQNVKLNHVLRISSDEPGSLQQTGWCPAEYHRWHEPSFIRGQTGWATTSSVFSSINTTTSNCCWCCWYVGWKLFTATTVTSGETTVIPQHETEQKQSLFQVVRGLVEWWLAQTRSSSLQYHAYTMSP